MARKRNGNKLAVASLQAVVLALAVLQTGTISAQVSEVERNALVDFYFATRGDDWINNDNWLGEPGSECAWYGVQCKQLDGVFSVLHLRLEANGLTGSLPDTLTDLARLQSLSLGRNQLTGDNLARAFLLPGLWTLDLNRNPLGSLPAMLPDTPTSLGHLNLAVTELEGGPPLWFAQLTVRDLDLSGNRLGSEIEPWLAALGDERIRLDLSRNRFKGPLPESLLQIDFSRNTSAVARGLNLCWNQFDEPFDSNLEVFLADVHVGETLADCNGLELSDMDATISGSWFNPEAGGKGYSLMLLESGQILYYWFAYPYISGSGAFAGDSSQQMWTLQIGAPEPQAARFPYALVPIDGAFGQGLSDGLVSQFGRRIVDIVRLGPDQLSVTTHSRPENPSIIISVPPPPAVQDRHRYQRLSQLAGSTCAKQSPYQQYSGIWYNPDADGEGFVIEVLSDDRAVIYWFTYEADGSGDQAWMIAAADIMTVASILPIVMAPSFIGVVDAQVHRPVGGQLLPEFDPSSIEMLDWGTLTIAFKDPEHGRVRFESNDPDFGSGEFLIERLARPMLVECDD